MRDTRVKRWEEGEGAKVSSTGLTEGRCPLPEGVPHPVNAVGQTIRVGNGQRTRGPDLLIGHLLLQPSAIL